MQFSHSSWYSPNTLVLWPPLPETFETNHAGIWFLYKAQTMGEVVFCHHPPVISNPSFFPPQQASRHPSSIVVLIATSWAKLMYPWRKQRKHFTHCWHDCPPLLQMNPIWLQLSLCFISSLLLSFVLSFIIFFSSFSTLALSFGVYAPNCGAMLLWKQLCRLFGG